MFAILISIMANFRKTRMRVQVAMGLKIGNRKNSTTTAHVLSWTAPTKKLYAPNAIKR